jgi:PAS domain S-box-containing protein
MPATTPPIRLLLIEDDAIDRREFTHFVRERNLPYEVTVALNLSEARRQLARTTFDIVVTDHQLPDGTAFDLFNTRENWADQIVILATGAGDEDTAARALRAGMRDYLIKDQQRAYLRRLPQQIDSALTERRLLRQVRENEARLRDLFDGTTDLIQSVAPDGQLQFVNRAWRETLGYALEDVGDLNIFAVIDPSCMAHCQTIFGQLLAGQDVGPVQLKLRTKDGRAVSLEGQVTVRRENGKMISTRGIFRNVTDRALAESAARLADQRLSEVLSVSSAVIFTCAAEPPFAATFVSPSSKVVWGYEPAQFTQPGFWIDHIHADDRARVQDGLNQTAVTGSCTQRYRFRRSDGAWRWAQDDVRLGAAEGATARQIVGVRRDITDEVTKDATIRTFQERTLRFQASLLVLHDRSSVAFEDFIRSAIELAATALDVGSTSLWFGDPTRDQMALLAGYRNDGLAPAPGTQLPVQRFPQFWAALCAGPVLQIDDVVVDPCTAGLAGSPLAPDSTRALIGVRLQFDGRPIGGLVFTRSAAEPAWAVDEVKFVQSVGNAIMLAFEQDKRRGAEAAERELRAHLEELVDSRTAALRETEGRFRQLAENIQEVFYIVDTISGDFVYVSPAFAVLFGRTTEALLQTRQTWFDAVHPEDLERVKESIAHRSFETTDIEYRIVQVDGQIHWVRDRSFAVRDDQGRVYRHTGLAEDITERKNAEQAILRRQRMESLGTLASGVAHDLNNALAPISLGAHLLRKKYPKEDRIISGMQASAQHGANMVRQLLTFAKGIEGERTGLNTLTLFSNLATLIESTFPRNITLTVTCPPEVPPVFGDETQLHQVLLNLCVNARDAMPDGGTLELDASTRHVDQTYASAIPEAKPGEYVVWQVADSGEGIPPTVLERIFDPFFSTKSPDKGTGLGLSTVAGIVRSHGGFVRVASSPGQRTIFSVFLPSALDRSRAAPARGVDTTAPLDGQGSTILVVDDQQSVREVSTAVLREMNFRVITANDGTDALICAVENRAALRGVITDLNMPHMDGLKLVRTLKHMLPGIPVVVCSGRVDEKHAHELAALGVVAVLHKPFDEVTFTAAIRQLMGLPPP